MLQWNVLFIQSAPKCFPCHGMTSESFRKDVAERLVSRWEKTIWQNGLFYFWPFQSTVLWVNIDKRTWFGGFLTLRDPIFVWNTWNKKVGSFTGLPLTSPFSWEHGISGTVQTSQPSKLCSLCLLQVSFCLRWLSGLRRLPVAESLGLICGRLAKRSYYDGIDVWMAPKSLQNPQ